MERLLEKYLPLRAPDAGGGGGGGDAGAGGDGGAGAAGGDGGAPSADPSAAQPYRPEGMADQYLGKSDKETIDSLYKAVGDFSEKEAARAVPDDAAAYGQFDMEKLGGDVPEQVRAHLPELAKDPAFLAAAESFKEAGVPVAAMQKGLLAAYKAMNDAGILEAPVDYKAERAKLLPESAKVLSQAQQDAAIEQRLQAAEDFVKLMMKPGADGKARLEKEVGENALLMLMDTGAGVQFLEFVQGLATGAGIAQPNAGTGAAPGGQGQREQLRARMAELDKARGTASFDHKAYEALMEDYKRAIPD